MFKSKSKGNAPASLLNLAVDTSTCFQVPCNHTLKLIITVVRNKASMMIMLKKIGPHYQF